MLVRRCVAALAACLMLLPVAHAWGPLGHRVVAELAQRHLDPKAEAEVEHLLALDHTRSLADIANWPDQIRNDPSQRTLWKQTAPLHYIDFASGPACDYVPARDCPGGRCVVAALDHYVAVLGDRAAPDAVRLQALKFVVHFIGDEHQPLHANYQQDRGGNTYQVQMDGRGTQLHRVWDSGMLDTRHLDWQQYADRLDAEGPVTLPPAEPPYDDAFAQWAEESCRITRGIYPPNHKIGAAYVQAELPVAETRLREAGRRLAEVLNLTLG